MSDRHAFDARRERDVAASRRRGAKAMHDKCPAGHVIVDSYVRTRDIRAEAMAGMDARARRRGRQGR